MMTAEDRATRETKEEQLSEIFGDDNRHYWNVNHPGEEPTDRDLTLWYLEHGGPEDFRERHPIVD
jgi:hypothetical protein